ncbi:hypothetical protein CRE_09534 [Caenorhabditis remanei]|uniref:L-Fucosyltransferase n=1 Tax=Caenorhabditis remanei TaxID=31234 RepID=E3MJ14_CAERE|nr:hypothetical protein CRE_09534 [Caenorhabditis remanei]
MFAVVFKTLIFLGTCATVVYHYYKNTKFDPMAVPYPPAKISFDTNQKYLSSDLFAGYQLGNNIFELAALYGLSKRLGRIPMFFIENDYYPRMKNKVENVMPGLMAQFLVVNGSVPGKIRKTKFHQKCCTFDNPKRLEKIEDEYLHLTGGYYQSWKYFPDMRDTLRDFLDFPDFEMFKNLPQSDENTHVTCVHTRRSDFIYQGFYSSDPVFIRNALIYISGKTEIDRKKHRKIVVFGDDQEFMRGIFNDSLLKENNGFDTDYFLSENKPSDDLIYSKYNCDIVLISAPRSTFGFWMGYLSKGNTVYHMDMTHENEQFYKMGEFNATDFFPPHWKTLDFASADNRTVVEKFRVTNNV